MWRKLHFWQNKICELDTYPLMKPMIFTRNIRRRCCIVFGYVIKLNLCGNLIRVLLLCSRNHIGRLLTCLRRWCKGVLIFELLCSAPQLGAYGSAAIGLGRSSPLGVFTRWVIELRNMSWNLSIRIINQLRLPLGVFRWNGLCRQSRYTKVTLMQPSLMPLDMLVLEWGLWFSGTNNRCVESQNSSCSISGAGRGHGSSSCCLCQLVMQWYFLRSA